MKIYCDACPKSCCPIVYDPTSGKARTATRHSRRQRTNTKSKSGSSRKARVANEWQFDKVTFSNGQDLTAGFADNSIEFGKDGTYIERDGTMAITGTWRFASDKEDLVPSPDDNSGAKVLHILRLKQDELWFTHAFNNGVYTYHLSGK